MATIDSKAQLEKVRERAFYLCKEYLQGRWKRISQSQLVLKQISGGLSNLVFYVGLPEGLEPLAREPRRVLLRLFGELGSGPGIQFRLIQETVVFTMLAERNLGPKLMGVFPGGRLEEFILGHPMSTNELRSPEYTSQIAKNTALVHSLEVPVSKDPSWMGDTMRGIQSKLAPIVYDSGPVNQREACRQLAQWDFRSEIDWLMNFLRHVPSPVVFSHNDINCGNILVREGNPDWDPVMFIDYEFASYNYRGFDLANHFIEWVYDYGTKVFPFYIRDKKQYPTRNQRINWLKSYLKTYEEQQQLQEENNMPHSTSTQSNIKNQIEDLLDEIDAFSLASHLLWAVWSIKQGQTSGIQFGYFNYANDRLKDYSLEKEAVIALFNNKRERKRMSESD